MKTAYRTGRLQAYRIVQGGGRRKISTDFKAGQTKMPGTGVSADFSIQILLQNIVDIKNGSLSKNDLQEKLHADEGQFSFTDPDSVNGYINSHGTEFVEVLPAKNYKREDAIIEFSKTGNLVEPFRAITESLGSAGTERWKSSTGMGGIRSTAICRAIPCRRSRFENHDYP